MNDGMMHEENNAVLCELCRLMDVKELKLAAIRKTDDKLNECVLVNENLTALKSRDIFTGAWMMHVMFIDDDALNDIEHEENKNHDIVMRTLLEKIVRQSRTYDFMTITGRLMEKNPSRTFESLLVEHGLRIEKQTTMNAYDIFAQRILAPLMLRIAFYECSIVVVHCKNDKALVKWFRDDMVPCVSFSSSKMFLDYLMSSICIFSS